MATSTDIIEIFSSIQGEGAYVGEQQLFVRFQGCSLSCQYCDTPTSFIKNERCRIEGQPFTKQFSYVDNPISINQLNELLTPFATEKTLSVTGGEPLEQVAFLSEWLPTLKGKYRVLLETAGVNPQELETILPWVDIVSMDLKLPSVTGMKAYWDEHEQFLKLAREKEAYVKVVISSVMSVEDFQRAVELVAAIDPTIPFMLQPAAAFAEFRDVPDHESLNAWHEYAAKRLQHVRQIPQLHKLLKVL